MSTQRIKTLHAVEPPASPEPVAWINKDRTYVELSTKATVYGSHTIPLHTQDALDAANLAGRADGWEACESCHGIVDGVHQGHAAANERIRELEIADAAWNNRVEEQRNDLAEAAKLIDECAKTVQGVSDHSTRFTAYCNPTLAAIAKWREGRKG